MPGCDGERSPAGGSGRLSGELGISDGQRSDGQQILLREREPCDSLPETPGPGGSDRNENRLSDTGSQEQGGRGIQRPGESNDQGLRDPCERPAGFCPAVPSSGYARVEAESVLFTVLSDGFSALMGKRWFESIHAAQRELQKISEETGFSEDEVLISAWETVLSRDPQICGGGRAPLTARAGALCILVTLAETRPEVSSVLPSMYAETMLAVWQFISGRPDALTAPVFPDRRSATAASGMLDALEKTVRKALSAPGSGSRKSDLLTACTGWLYALNGFPLAPSFPGRQCLLKGAGNAIVPELAAVFVSAFEDAVWDTHDQERK